MSCPRNECGLGASGLAVEWRRRFRAGVDLRISRTEAIHASSKRRTPESDVLEAAGKAPSWILVLIKYEERSNIFATRDVVAYPSRSFNFARGTGHPCIFKKYGKYTDAVDRHCQATADR